MGMQLIETITLASAGTLSITGIPQDGTDLLVTLSGRSSNVDHYLNFNNNNSGVYNRRFLRGTGSAVASGSSTSATELQFIAASAISDTANTFSNASIYITNYTSSTAKSVSIDSVTENNGSTAFQNITAGLFNSTAPITSIQTLYYNFEAGTTASLYKITAD